MGAKDDSDDFSRWDSIYIACRMDFIIDVLHCWIVGTETLNRLSRSIVHVFLLFIFYESKMKNIYQNLPFHLPDECVDVLQSNSNVTDIPHPIIQNLNISKHTFRQAI